MVMFHIYYVKLPECTESYWILINKPPVYEYWGGPIVISLNGKPPPNE